jgi:hypothetical protein
MPCVSHSRQNRNWEGRFLDRDKTLRHLVNRVSAETGIGSASRDPFGRYPQAVTAFLSDGDPEIGRFHIDPETRGEPSIYQIKHAALLGFIINGRGTMHVTLTRPKVTRIHSPSWLLRLAAGEQIGGAFRRATNGHIRSIFLTSPTGSCAECGSTTWPSH